MAMILHDDAPHIAHAMELRPAAIDFPKLAVWIVAAAVPWMAIIGGVKLVLTLLG